MGDFHMSFPAWHDASAEPCTNEILVTMVTKWSFACDASQHDSV